MDAPVVAEAARQLGELFPDVYLALHRRDAKRRALPAASRAVLQHLTLTGPVRIGELARHLSRAQSVVSDIVTHPRARMSSRDVVALLRGLRALVAAAAAQVPTRGRGPKHRPKHQKRRRS
jgi:hypothetical protein